MLKETWAQKSIPPIYPSVMENYLTHPQITTPSPIEEGEENGLT